MLRRLRFRAAILSIRYAADADVAVCHARDTLRVTPLMPYVIYALRTRAILRR